MSIADGRHQPSSRSQTATGCCRADRKDLVRVSEVPGPGGTGEVFFTATTVPQIAGRRGGDRRGQRHPDARGSGQPRVQAVDPRLPKQHVARLTLSTCTGVTNAECAGKMTLSVKAKVEVQRQVRAAAQGVSRPGSEPSPETTSLKLGSVPYDIPGASTLSQTDDLTDWLPTTSSKQVSGHKWTAIVTDTPTVGCLHSRCAEYDRTGSAEEEDEVQDKRSRRAAAPKTMKKQKWASRVLYPRRVESNELEEVHGLAGAGRGRRAAAT